MHTAGRNEYIVRFEELAAEVDQALAELAPAELTSAAGTGAGRNGNDPSNALTGNFQPAMTRAERRKRDAEYALIS